MINIELLVKDKINTLWSEFGNEDYCQFSPNSIAEIPKDGLVFIGINPSMTDKVKEQLIEKNDIIYLDMSFEEASKFVVSAGTTSP